MLPIRPPAQGPAAMRSHARWSIGLGRLNRRSPAPVRGKIGLADENPGPTVLDRFAERLPHGSRKPPGAMLLQHHASQGCSILDKLLDRSEEIRSAERVIEFGYVLDRCR